MSQSLEIQEFNDQDIKTMRATDAFANITNALLLRQTFSILNDKNKLQRILHELEISDDIEPILEGYSLIIQNFSRVVKALIEDQRSSEGLKLLPMIKKQIELQRREGNDKIANAVASIIKTDEENSHTLLLELLHSLRTDLIRKATSFIIESDVSQETGQKIANHYIEDYNPYYISSVYSNMAQKYVHEIIKTQGQCWGLLINSPKNIHNQYKL